MIYVRGTTNGGDRNYQLTRQTNTKKYPSYC